MESNFKLDSKGVLSNPNKFPTFFSKQCILFFLVCNKIRRKILNGISTKKALNIQARFFS